MSDPLSVVEAAREIENDEQEWLERIVRAAAAASPWFRAGFCHIYDASDPARFRSLRAAAVVPGVAALMSEVMAATPPEVTIACYRTTPVGTLSTLLPDYATNPVVKVLRSHRFEDAIGVAGGDPTGHGALLGGWLTRRTRLDAAQRHEWSLLAVHIATAFRLRRELTGDVLDGAHAVLSPDGTIQHAEGRAQTLRSREALRRAARLADRARGPLRRRDPLAALELWEAMVEGRWSLVDKFDSDGRRFVVARLAEPTRATPVTLTPRERQIAALAALGHSQKLIAYELGLASSTVSQHLEAALAKLKVKSHAELAAHFVGAVATDAPPRRERGR